MDGLSVAASVIAALQLTAKVIGYLKDVKDCPKECQQCLTEVSNLQELLRDLLTHLIQATAGDSWYTAVKKLDFENGPIAQYTQALQELLSRVDAQEGLQNVKQRLLWKFSKAEVANILERIERLKSLIDIALQMDHL